MILGFDNDIGYIFIAGFFLVGYLGRLWYTYRLRRLYADMPPEVEQTTVVIPEEPGHPMAPPETP